MYVHFANIGATILSTDTMILAIQKIMGNEHIVMRRYRYATR